MGEIEVLHPGLYSTLQDSGRFGFRKFGVPLSGAMDSKSAIMANFLLQNDNSAAVLEITLQGPKLKFSAPTEIVICGAKLSPKLDDFELQNNQVYAVDAGQILSFGKRITGYRTYLGIKNGFKTNEVLGSLSWCYGITEHFRLEKGMKIPYEESIQEQSKTNAVVKVETSSELIKAFAGPEYHLLSSNEKNLLKKSHFWIGKESNRMGIQLKGELSNNLSPIITSPVLPGTVQLTPAGKLIVLMRDGQTTGGYPRVLQLSEDGINALSQKLPGENVRFHFLQ